MQKKVKAERAFKWLVRILIKRKVPFQITGGLAAKAYGSPRPLADIDFEIPEKRFADILPDVRPHIVWGPERRRKKPFDLVGMELNYKGQQVDVSGTGTGRLFDRKKKRWVSERIDLTKAVRRRIFGLQAPVITKKDLIAYKRKLLRKVDKIDIKFMIIK